VKPKESPGLGLRLSVSLDGTHLIIKIPITRIFEVVAPEAGRTPETISCSFTPRQREVFDLLCEGRCGKEIAENLHVSPSAIKHHISDVLRKVGASSTREILQYYGKVAILQKRTA
jgi:DNA-binding NarL/FixJ family response regulator